MQLLANVMARLLVKAIDASHPDKEKDEKGSYKIGDVVFIAPDDHVWGKKEFLPKFCWVEIPGASVESLAWMTAVDEEEPSEFLPVSIMPIKAAAQLLTTQTARKSVHKRRFRLDMDAIAFADGKASVANVDLIDKRKGKKYAS